MTAIQVIENPVLEGKRRAFVLAEDRVGHYPEFREFFVRQFSLGTNGLSRPGYVRAPSGMVYALVFIGRSGEPFPDGIEIYALPDALEPLNDPEVDADIWALLGWMIAGVGGEWRIEDLDATGRLYQLSVAVGPCWLAR
ncbi:hypothetical protein [Bradyrhizobium sp. AZCC 2230]|uniref:hypothetical protein n=1 Tax=Bradyrhizobium sp. AZCC 2230 TaxID=3117021 RepID=UPI002FF11E55